MEREVIFTTTVRTTAPDLDRFCERFRSEVRHLYGDGASVRVEYRVIDGDPHYPDPPSGVEQSGSSSVS